MAYAMVAHNISAMLPIIFLIQFGFAQHTNKIHTMEAYIFPQAECHIHLLHAQRAYNTPIGSIHKLFTERPRQLEKLCVLLRNE